MRVNSKSVSIVLMLLITLVFSVVFSLTLFAQAGPTPATSSPSPSQDPERATALREYREVLEKERKILEDQSREYYTRVEKFAYLSLAALGFGFTGVILFFKWMFGQTRTEIISQLKLELQSSVLSSAKDELERFKREKIEPLNAEYQRLQEQLEIINSFGSRQVIWLLRENMPRPEGEIVALHSVGLTRVMTAAPKEDSEAEIKEALKKADLAIITFDGSAESRTLLRNASTALKFRQPPISLLIYTYGFYLENRPVQLCSDDLEYLKDLSSFAPANFPATLISQAQSLLTRHNPVRSRDPLRLKLNAS
jgi:hypothetical protein